MAFSRNWEISQVGTKDRHHGWQQEFFFVTTRRTLQNAVLGNKYFKANIIQHNQIIKIFSLFIINLVGVWFIKINILILVR